MLRKRGSHNRTWRSVCTPLRGTALCWAVALPTLLTQLSGVAGQADAGEGPGSIQAGGAVQTRVGLAFIQLCKHHTLALTPLQPRWTVASCACGRARSTCLTALPGEPRRAHAHVSQPVFVAGTSVLTRAAGTRQKIYTKKVFQISYHGVSGTESCPNWEIWFKHL